MMLTHDKLLAVLSYDQKTGLFRWLKQLARRAPIGAIAGHVGPYGYRYIRIDCRLYKASRLAWFYVHGKWPRLVDHKDLDQANDAIGNLREATLSQNGANRLCNKNSKSRIKGVSYDSQRRRWVAQVRCIGMKSWGARFLTQQEAVAAVYEKRKIMFGEFANGETSNEQRAA